MLLEMKNISKSFGAVKAVQDVSLSIGEAEVHGLLGENGAGKSTLMNVLGGILRPDRGVIVIGGEEYTHLTPLKATHLGIGFIHQELNLVNDLYVYENLFLHHELTRFGVLNKKEMIRRSNEIFKKMNLDIDPLAMVGDLDTSRKQLIEIAGALLFDCRLIIMDEPTTALTNEEIDNLFTIIRGLKEHGISCIYISHKMPELFEICDRYTVMRDGKHVATGDFKDIDEHQATEMLVGRSLAGEVVEKSNVINTNDIVMDVKGLSCHKFFQDVSFSLRKGEILAVTGLFGDGRGELSECLFGARKTTDGAVFMNGRNMTGKSIIRNMKAGISMVPRNRKERSILKDMTILDNLSMAFFTSKHKSLYISNRKEHQRYDSQRKATNIKAESPDNLITSLSGGNQQKVVFSRWFGLDSDVFILDNPTQGIDVGAKFEIYQLITALAEKGKSVVVFSSEYPEIHQIADRCLVLYKGRINKEFKRDELNEVDVMYYATGSNLKEASVG